ncbi:MAG: DASS family sodium-coupled anion symporter [Steroidobacteraceae bacterium]|jgi:sodium-dependent dicarboxylate transporter 2/3/5|nr:DASS family sodium-coupled anion symporter [Steroidobacteraceae bacterium]
MVKIPRWLALLSRSAALIVAVVAALAATEAALASGAMPREAAFMAGIFVLAALLWMTEALPLFATALLVVGLQLVLLANPGGWHWLGFESGPSPDYADIVSAAADPVLLLFFGGFLLAQAAVKEGVDRSMSALLLRPFGDRPLAALAGVMTVTALFSMFMSNTATTAMMLALVAPMLVRMGPAEPFRRAIVLAVPFAANIGGMGTPIGSPPNAVAVGQLQQAGIALSFLDWMLVAVPLMVACLALAGWLLWRFHRPLDPTLRITITEGTIGARGWLVVVVFALTVLLWLTDSWHGLPAAVVALLPAVVLTATRTLTADDLQRIDWSVLILIAGGISLGAGMTMTGLDRIVVGWLPLGPGHAIAWLVAVLATAALLLSTFMSNTAAANLLLPIGLSATVALAGQGALPEVAMSIAFAASLAMSLPISTPPNAMAHSTRAFDTRDMARAGAIIGLTGTVIVVLGVPLLVRAFL